jgi:phosphoribosylformylglycinamidine synthase
VVGILEDVHQAGRIDFREPGRSIVLLRANEPGDITDVESEFGSSEYAKKVLGALWGYPPELDLEKEAALQEALVEIVRAGLVDSAHDCSEGGLAVTLAESGFPKNVGLRVNLAGHDLPPEYVLFGEDASRVVLSCDPGNVSRIQQVAVKYRLSADSIGETIPDKIEIQVDGRAVVSAKVSELNALYEGALEQALRTDPTPVAAD